MIFIITITDPKANIIFNDLFQMNNESEVYSKFQFLEANKPFDKTHPIFYLEIKTYKHTLIKISENSITNIQKHKEKIYDVLIENIKAHKLRNTH